MNALVTKFAPPTIVLGAAFYLGAPPAAPLDLGESVVKAAAVRWKKDDLLPPVINRPAISPFGEVLVASEEMEVEPETGKLVVATKPAGPDPEDLRSGLQLVGIAQMGGRKWAVINGKPRLPGDKLNTDDNKQLTCTIVSVESDHAVVSCEETVIKLRARPIGAAAPSTTPIKHVKAETKQPENVPVPPPSA
jgi:hypothetical protein